MGYCSQGAIIPIVNLVLLTCMQVNNAEQVQNERRSLCFCKPRLLIRLSLGTFCVREHPTTLLLLALHDLLRELYIFYEILLLLYIVNQFIVYVANPKYFFIISYCIDKQKRNVKTHKIYFLGFAASSVNLQSLLTFPSI